MLWIFFFFIVCKIYFLSVLILFEHDETQTFTRPNFESGKLWCLFAKRWTTFCLASSCTAFSQAFASIGFGDVSQTNGPEEPRQKQSAHAFGSAAECLLILTELQEVIFLVFRKLLRTVGNRRGSLHNRLCYPDNFNHSHQITQSEKMLIIAIRWNVIGSLPQFGTEEQLL